MGLLGSGSSHPLLILINAGLRACEFILAVVCLGLYAQFLSWENSNFEGQHEQKAITAVATSSIALITALIFGLVPLFTSNFFHVAVACLWDFIVFILWCAVFGLFHNEFISELNGIPGSDIPKFEGAEISKMRAAVWIDLVCLLFWLATTILGVVGLFLGRRNRKVG